MQLIASIFYKTRTTGLFFLVSLALAGCALPRPDGAVAVHDFGPGALQGDVGNRMAPLSALELAPVQASSALGSTAMLYRLVYADARQPRPYALARWSMPPAQLIGQRLREQLGQRRAVLAPGDVVPTRAARTSSSRHTSEAAPIPSLRVELEEFSQLFESPDKSSALVRLRATVMQHGAEGHALSAQRSFIVQHGAPTPDARGGVQALTRATDQAIAEIETWLEQIPR